MPRLKWVIFSCIIIFILSVTVTSYIKEIRKIYHLSSILDSKMDHLVKKSRKIQDYRTKIEYYSSPEGVERMAREDFNMMYPGEKVYRIVVISKDALSE